MKKLDTAERPASLVVDLISGTVILHGQEVELPFREFRLLAALAQRVGEPIPSERLIEAVWPDEPWSDRQKLWHLLSRLRQQIDGEDNFAAHIRNRRGFGYFLDLSPEDVRVLDESAARSSSQVIDLQDQPAEPEVKTASGPVDKDRVTGEEGAPPPLRLGRLALVSAFTVAALAAAGTAGYLVSKSRAERIAGVAAATDSSDATDPPEVPQDAAPKTKKKNKERHNGKVDQARGKGGSVISGPAVTTGTAPVAVAPGSAQKPGANSNKTNERREAPQPSLPPAPTGYLYHLLHPETGDHFVTTDGGTASQYEGKGYQGGVIGGIYTSPPDGLATKSIATNAGTGYIFASSAPKTEPASRTLPLYYSSNGKGDFFYTTRANEANQAGWDGGLVGYVRAP